jgi:hypothetical protein
VSKSIEVVLFRLKRPGAGPVALVVALIALALPSAAHAYLYWTNFEGGKIGRADLDGSAANPEFITGASEPIDVVASDQSIYWGNLGGIGRSDLGGIAPNQGFIGIAAAPYGLAVDGQHLYWASPASGYISRSNLDGSDPILGFLKEGAGTTSVAVDAKHIYWANYATDSIGRANLDGTEADPGFIEGASYPLGVAVDSTHVYWANLVSNSIGRANLDGSAVDQSFVTGAKGIREIAVDAEHIYWPDGGNEIGRANIDGTGSNPKFITVPGTSQGIAVDSLPHGSSTSVACTAAAAAIPPAAITCTATLTDTGPFSSAPGPLAPSAAVAFSSSGAGAFTPSPRCSPIETVAGQSTCQLTFTPAAVGSQTIAASFTGDAVHSPSHAQTTIVSPLPKPSNSFTLGKRKLNKRKGLASLTALLPGPGDLRLEGKAVKARDESVSGGEAKLTVAPLRKTRRKLRRKGKAKVGLSVLYTPAGGDPRSDHVNLILKLVKRPH